MALRGHDAPVAPTRARSGASRDAFIVSALIVLALVLRITRLDFQPLWWDEGYSVWFASHPLAEMMRLTALDIHPPLYYALLGGWTGVLGLGPLALRLLSVVFGVLAVPLSFVVGTWLAGRRAGLIAALLLAVNPLHVFYSQEVRMYGLVLLWALFAIGFAARAAGMGVPGSGSGEVHGAAAIRDGRGKWLAGYCVAMTLALYTQYYAGFLAAGLAMAGLVELWRQRRRRLAAAWLAAQAVVVGLFLPWVLYAGPRLAAYVSQKVVADSDRPLGLVTYLARHLSAYTAGHFEGPLAPWWPLGLLGVAVLAWAFWRLVARRRSRPVPPPSNRTFDAVRVQSPFPALRFLSIALATVLLLGWIVNLSFPFFPERGERLLLLGLPLFLLLVATTIAALWESALERRDGEPARSVSRSPRLTIVLLLAPFVILAAGSLVAFYLVPRYAGEDYRPLIGQVEQWGRPEDTVLAVFPWQVGYFLSYGHPDGPQPLLSPSDDWTPEIAMAVDKALARGRLWFPEHLSLGALFENAAEAFLSQEKVVLANRWYSPSTRLTGWAAPPATSAGVTTAGPFRIADRTLASAVLHTAVAEANNEAVQLDLNWTTADPAERFVSLHLDGPDGRTWASQDLALSSSGLTDRVGVIVPSGTPPGGYSLRLSLLDSAGGQPLPVGGANLAATATSLEVGQVVVMAPDGAPPVHTLPFEQTLDVALEDAVQILGVSATPGPLQPGEDLSVSLFWQALPGIGTAAAGDLFTVIQLLDSADQVVAGWEGPPVDWHPTSAWRPGELVRTQGTLRLPATLADGRYRLVAGVFDPSNNTRLAASWKSGPWRLVSQRGETVPLGVVEIAGREHVTAPPQPQVGLSAELAHVGRLVGYDLAATRVAPGESIDLTLYWQAKETTGDRLKIFVHLLDAQGVMIGQSDGEPGAGAYPTSGWVPGEYLVDRHRLTVRSDAPPGPATIVVGLYDPITGARVPWLDLSGRVDGESLDLPQGIAIETP